MEAVDTVGVLDRYTGIVRRIIHSSETMSRARVSCHGTVKGTRLRKRTEKRMCHGVEVEEGTNTLPRQQDHYIYLSLVSLPVFPYATSERPVHTTSS